MEGQVDYYYHNSSNLQRAASSTPGSGLGGRGFRMNEIQSLTQRMPILNRNAGIKNGSPKGLWSSISFPSSTRQSAHLRAPRVRINILDATKEWRKFIVHTKSPFFFCLLYIFGGKNLKVSWSNTTLISCAKFKVTFTLPNISFWWSQNFLRFLRLAEK